MFKIVRKIGFTGSSKNITLAQGYALRDVFSGLIPAALARDNFEFHHGDCLVGDATAHQLILQHRRGVKIHLHPPIDPKKRAFCSEAYLIHPEKPYLDRDRDIVDATEVLVACPDRPERSAPRSGTWYTVRYARRCKRSVVIVWPDGHIDGERL